MVTAHVILLLLALFSFVAAAVGMPARVNMIAVGLALWVLALLVG